MPINEHELWHMLHALDDPDNFERPDNYDHRVRERFEQLALRLIADFGDQCRVDRDVQDASLHGRIDIPTTAAASGRPLVVLISNFGSLAVVIVDNPGVWRAAEAAELLHPDDAIRIATALVDLNYTLIPEEPLWEPYDGVSDPSVFATWWHRYFEYI